jgi:hypothetical protein
MFLLITQNLTYRRSSKKGIKEDGKSQKRVRHDPKPAHI